MVDKRKRKRKVFLPVQCQNPMCGKMFTPTRNDQKFCSAKCRSITQNMRRGHLPVMTVCPNCKTTFANTKPEKQIYCSKECREEHQNRPNNQSCANCATECPFPEFINEFSRSRPVMCFNRRIEILLANTWCTSWSERE